MLEVIGVLFIIYGGLFFIRERKEENYIGRKF